ncbi:MAG: hypothetical protein A2070_01535 [Bdellovibrionales bacterium GWC1_52_8]|nr:MAG: hypothetical protein A2Z97_01125 [Bdellovibrionales bacterium GWB1_52_6]OFZ05424.1 MAG: hypothetical protein A2X97_11125 [Bdellovibrionales bacterium GWA1_52_35]OFZ41446.1 MAG: hypothetical protein A2070_01535 [Bdellovibrionales bacterium GWC1_52_8]HCM39214.1 hypothetical protein [Bdellovibrionales bacterium]
MAISTFFKKTFRKLSFLSGFWLGLWPAFAQAGDIPTIPDSIRTRPFSGVSSTVRGDIRTVGMAGATIGLGDTFIAASDNPAGLAMTMNTGDFNLTTNWVRDSYVQEWGNPTQSNNFGVALSPYPWGFSLGYSTPFSEGQFYKTQTGTTVLMELEIQEYRAALARVFMENRLAVGVSLGFGRATAKFSPEDDLFIWQNNAWSFAPSLGAMYQFSNRLLLGLSYRFPVRYDGTIGAKTPGLADYFQPFITPGRLGLGLGWIPNRFFRTDFSLFVIGPTPEAGFLSNQVRTVGGATTLQPRLGAAYDFLEFKDFRATAFAGSYYEVSRIQDTPNRLHLTMGVETHPWIFTIGTGADFAWQYRNFLVTAGLDLIRFLQKLELVPVPWQPPRGGIFPSATKLSDEGLARPLIKIWNPMEPEIDPIQVGLDLPKSIEKRAIKAGRQIKDLTGSLFQTKPAAKTPKTPSKPKPKTKVTTKP